jgi:hypothetical protein
MRHRFLASTIAVAAPLLFLSTVASAQTPTQPPADPEPPQLPAPAASPAPAARPAPAAAAPARVEPATYAPPGEPHEDGDAESKDRSVYVSISPLHLFLPFVELSAEVRLHERIGVAAIGGYGSVRPKDSSTRFDVWEVGGQLVGYPVGHFDHGMQLGIEALYAGVSGDDKSGNTRIAATASGFASGPFVGYKLATRSGFSFNLQGGISYLLVQAEASSSTGQSATADQTRVLPIVNANLGWSF